jgi:hypothetical protein
MIVKIITEEVYREGLRKLMLEEETKGHLLTEADRIKNMNASPENFVNYLQKHNLWITKENYTEFSQMYIFKSFSSYIKKVRKTMGIKVYLPDDDKIIRDAKKIVTELISICKKENTNKKENPILIQTGKTNPISSVIENLKFESIKIVRNEPKKELVIVKKSQEKIEVVFTRKTMETRKNLDVLVEREKKNVFGPDEQLERKCEKFRNVMEQGTINLNVVVEAPKEEKKKEPYKFVYNETKQMNIEVKTVKKIVDEEEIPEPKIIKEDGVYKVIKENPDSEIMKELLEDDPVIKIPEDLSCEEKKFTKEEIIEEATCHGEIMGKFSDAVDESMVGGDRSLKEKIVKDRKIHLEKKTFEERRNNLEEFFKTNVELMLENRRIMS